MYDLADGIREISRKRVAACRRKRIASNVALLTYQDQRGAHGHYHGLLLCGSVWECPICRLQICAHRASEVEQVVEAHRSAYGPDTVYLLTVTTRHGMGDDLATVRRGVAGAWRGTTQGRWWVELNRKFGIKLTRRWCNEWRADSKVGLIRALEVTYGHHGWHVHLHLVLLAGRSLSPDELQQVRSGRSALAQAGRQAARP